MLRIKKVRLNVYTVGQEWFCTHVPNLDLPFCTFIVYQIVAIPMNDDLGLGI